MFVTSAPDVLIRLLLGPECAACGTLLERPLSSPVCEACWRAVVAITPPCCVRCGDALASWRAVNPLCARCQRQKAIISLARSGGHYDGSLRAIIHAFKYQRRRLLAEPLAALMRAAGRDVLDGADAVVPVPLHRWRALARGFNQADDLARLLGLPVWRVLRRRRLGRPQAGLAASQRHRNVRRAFELRRGLGARPARRALRNRTVVLIDDVMTTGATLQACADVLQAAGVRSVRALTAARAVTGRHATRPPRPDLSAVPHR